MKAYPREMVWRARGLRAQGATQRAIAQELGISKPTVRRWLDPEVARLQKVREREYRNQRAGVCLGCNALTHYNATSPGHTARYCRRCAAERRAFAQRAQGPTISKVLELISPDLRFIDICRLTGFSERQVSGAIQRLLRFDMIERVACGRYQRIER